MPGASEVKSRIDGINDTKKITDAMYMISSAKMRRALQDLEATTPYYEALRESIGELLRCFPQTENRYFEAADSAQKPHRNHGILLITSDKGLAGSYNHEAIRTSLRFASQYAKTTFFIIGEYGRQYFLNHKLDFDREFYHCAVRPSMPEARRICTELLERYDSRDLDDIAIIYTDFTANKAAECKPITLLPLRKTAFAQGAADGRPEEREFLPGPEAVLDGVIPSYLTGFIYGSLVESYCSEQQARMNAMKSAGSNAEDMLKSLNIQYNKLRQAAITGEITEITAGAGAQKKKRTRSGAGENNEQ